MGQPPTPAVIAKRAAAVKAEVRPHVRTNRRPKYTPSPAQIEQRAAEVRSQWSEEVELRRSGRWSLEGEAATWLPPTVASSERLTVDERGDFR